MKYKNGKKFYIILNNNSPSKDLLSKWKKSDQNIISKKFL